MPQEVPQDTRRDMTAEPIVLRPIAWVASPLLRREDAPRQGPGAPDATIVFEDWVVEGLRDLRVGEDILVLTWLDRAARDVLLVHPRRDPSSALKGVFSTRAPDRPNPIGLHRVGILAIDRNQLRVRNLEALDGTPVVDVKPLPPGGWPPSDQRGAKEGSHAGQC